LEMGVTCMFIVNSIRTQHTPRPGFMHMYVS